MRLDALGLNMCGGRLLLCGATRVQGLDFPDLELLPLSCISTFLQDQIDLVPELRV